MILIGSVSTKGLQRVSADGGTLSQITTLDDSRNESAHLRPQFLPDGRHFLYLAVGGPEDMAVYAGSLDSAERTLVLKSQHMAHFAAVDVERAGAGLKFGVPAALFDSYAATNPHAGLPFVFQYAVSSDGNRFLVARQLGAENSAPGETPLTVVLNWTSLLNR